jgi:ATP-dependent 26S proteasome regulatory subunit
MKAGSKDSRESGPGGDGNGGDMSYQSIAIEITKWGIFFTISYIITSKISDALQKMISDGSGEVISARRVLSKRLKRPEVEVMDMNAYEARISVDVFSCDELDISFENVGGMEEEVSEVKDNVVLPMQMWKLFKGTGNIAPCPTGVLLYGRPGTGKTLIAKAIVKECGATFINIKASAVMDKWLGESDKLIVALFSLARKLAPTVIFIDEIDTLLKKREGDHNSNISSMQGAFLTEWDGLSSMSSAPVVVLGATNRCVCVYIYTCMFIYMYIYIYIYMYIYVYIYIHIYIHIYMYI